MLYILFLEFIKQHKIKMTIGILLVCVMYLSIMNIVYYTIIPIFLLLVSVFSLVISIGIIEITIKSFLSKK